jgi:hypothetical protein
MDVTQHFEDLVWKARNLVGMGKSDDLTIIMNELAEIKLTGGDGGSGLRIQEVLLPDTVIHEAQNVWITLWDAIPEWEKAETVMELVGHPSAEELYVMTDWDDDQQIKRDVERALGLSSGNDDEDDEDEVDEDAE